MATILSGVQQPTNIFVPCGKTAVYSRAIYTFFTQINITEIPSFSFSATPSDIQHGIVQTLTQPTCTNPSWTIQATPNTGYTFSRWSDGNTQNPRTLTITQDTVLIAFFASNQGIAEAENDNVSIRTANGHILLEGINGERVFVSDVLGRVIYHATVNEKAEIAVLNRGVYFVKGGNRPAQKVVVIR